MAIEKVLRFVVTCWDGDIYILEGYESVAQIREAIGALEWVIMPNGAEIKTSAISKIQPFEDYRFQADQKRRHKIGQYLSLNLSTWRDPMGETGDADVKSITGVIKNTELPKSTVKHLTSGK